MTSQQGFCGGSSAIVEEGLSWKQQAGRGHRRICECLELMAVSRSVKRLLGSVGLSLKVRTVSATRLAVAEDLTELGAHGGEAWRIG